MQDYAGRKELVILNDMPEQKLVYEHPEVRIINSPKRITPLGKKFNDCLGYCKGEVLFVWDDDDIYLPWRLSYSIENMKEGLFHTKHAFFETANDLSLKTGYNYFHCNLAFERRLLDKIGHYKEEDVASLDIDFMSRLAVVSQNVRKKDYFYIYRWSGTDSFHVSQWNNNGVSACADAYVAKQIKAGQCETGEILLRPHWSRDWLTLSQDAISGLDISPETISYREEVLEIKDGFRLESENNKLIITSSSNVLTLKCNATTALIFQTINGRRTNFEIEKLLCEIFHEKSISSDVISTLNVLKESRIVQACGSFSNRLKIAIVTQITPEIDGYGKHTESINQAYAKQAGYDFHVLREWSFTERAVTWGTVYMLRKYLSQYDYLFWMDADAVVSRFDISLEKFIRQMPDKDILACDDRPMGSSIVNAGTILVKNSTWSKKFLDSWWERGLQKKYNAEGLTDQWALSDLYAENEQQVQDHLHVFPTKSFNSIFPGQNTHQSDDFILHLMATSNNVREKIFSELRDSLLG
jgi:hypothetical protein